ncbi:MAG: hypothetical protein ACI8W8_003648 [Rhodothermales bacterium]|jgi:hypothetical protein
MGYRRFDSTQYSHSASAIRTQPREQVFAERGINDDLNPVRIQLRESRDSELKPKATPLIVGLDVTGSMGHIAEIMAKEKLGILVDEVLQRKPVDDPHLMFMGIGDVVYDQAPLQVTQFEPDNVIVDQLTRIWLEGGGGGNSFESYDLAWMFAAYRTASDHWDKRKKKGYLFTIGDELFPKETSRAYAKRILGADCPWRIDPMSVYKAACKRYHVFHVVVEQGHFASRRVPAVMKDWRKHLGRRVLPLSDYNHVAEVIVSAMAVQNGQDYEQVVTSWPPKVADTVRHALEAQ